MGFPGTYFDKLLIYTFPTACRVSVGRAVALSYSSLGSCLWYASATLYGLCFASLSLSVECFVVLLCCDSLALHSAQFDNRQWRLMAAGTESACLAGHGRGRGDAQGKWHAFNQTRSSFICLLWKFSAPATDNEFCALSSIITPRNYSMWIPRRILAESWPNPCRLSNRAGLHGAPASGDTRRGVCVLCHQRNTRLV